ncbi:MAG: exodeoxyribonuclease VII large subunit [Methylomicrobium sp.]|nr:exodeoxyribonuclease VII large subunit [Methylomicrobium sp.]
MNKDSTDFDQKILTVSQLNSESKRLLNEHFLSVRVEGEISNLTTPSSGHIYFTLKDSQSQVRCAMFRSQNRRTHFKPENGMQVIARAQVTLYEPRGDYQLVVDELEEIGDGALRRAFEALKFKLGQEGLFDARYKKAPPLLPSAIGVITSPTGAAIRDVLTVLKRRFPAIPVVIYPTVVQGENAKYEITKAINTAAASGHCDVIILARGGGSLEDLWAFNEEIVARAIFACPIPIIAGIGHEIDFTIADFVADLRAATPSAAAEHAVPDQREWQTAFQSYALKLQLQLSRQLAQQQQKMEWIAKRLEQQHPGQKLARNAQRVDEMELRMMRAIGNLIHHHKSALAIQSAKLNQQLPSNLVNTLKMRLAHSDQRLSAVLRVKLDRLTQRLVQAGQNLHAYSPLATLNRGYALVTEIKTGKLISSSTQLKEGDRIHTRLAEGSLISEVKQLSGKT